MRSRPWWVLLVLPILPLWRAVFLGQAIGPWDQIRTFAPWVSGRSDRPWDVLQADGALQFYVWRDLVFESWGKFQIPFWNHYELAGTPLLANSQSGALYPPHILMGVLHIPTQWAVTLLAWFHLAWAGLGVFALARRLGASDTGAILAGASFTLCPFMVTWTALASVISTVSWIPWALAFTLQLTEARPLSTPKVPPQAAALLAICVGMMLLAGHLQFAAYGFLAIAIVGVTRVRSAGVFGTAHVVGAVFFGIAIAAPQLGPVLGYSQFSHRRADATAEGYQAYADSAIRPFEFGNLVNPFGLGNPRVHASSAHISSYWVPMVKRGANFAEAAVSPGAVALAFLCLLPLARRKLKPAIGVAVVGIVGLLLATGTPLAQAMYFGVPGWSSTGSPGRAIILFVLAACVLAGLAASSLFDPETRPKNPRGLQLGALAFAILTAATVGLGITGAKTPVGMEHDAFQAIVGTASASGIMVTFLVAIVAIQPALMGYFRSRGQGTVSPVVLILGAIVAVSFFVGADQWIMTSRLPEPVKQGIGGKYERVAFINQPWDLMVVQGANLPPNLAALYRIHDLAGYDSLLHRDTVAMMREVNSGKDPAPAANGNIMFVKPSATPESLSEAGTTVVVSPKFENATSSSPTNQIWEPIPGPGRASVDGKPAEIIYETFSSLTVRAEGPGTLTLRDRMMPGWTATVDGAEVPIPDDRWRIIALPSGVHTVRFSYWPPGFLGYLGVCFVGWAAVGTVLLIRRRERLVQSSA